MLACHLKEGITPYLLKKNMAVIYEAGVCKWGKYRADVLAMSMKSEIWIIECKSGLADFRSDKKWKNYLDFSHKFYFAVDAPTYEKIKDKVPKGYGVMVVDRAEIGNRVKYSVTVAQKAKRRDLPVETQLNLATRMVFRTADCNRYKRS